MATEKKYYLPEGLPAPRAQRDGLDKEFWDATRRHELVVQRCNGCGTFQWGPEWICHKCHSADHLGWHKVSGRGRLFSWIRNWNPVHPALKEACPYIVAVVELPDAGMYVWSEICSATRRRIRLSTRQSKPSSRTMTKRHWCSGRWWGSNPRRHVLEYRWGEKWH